MLLTSTLYAYIKILRRTCMSVIGSQVVEFIVEHDLFDKDILLIDQIQDFINCNGLNLNIIQIKFTQE